MKNKYWQLVEESRRAVEKGFYTSSVPCRRYGAAVLTKSGKMYSAGQYSSFNHITSIHAEMGAILMATMNGDSQIEALALSSNVTDNVCSCGVCLQFMKEHAERTEDEMLIIYDEKDSIRQNKLGELTRELW